VPIIELLAVPAEADERFLAARADAPGTMLHRALRDDADFRFVAVAAADAAAPGGEFPSQRALYEVVHESGTPEGAGGVVLIEPFAVPEDADAGFLAGWHRRREALAGQHGHLGTRLYRAVGPAGLRFVEVARWSSPLMYARAIARPEHRAAAIPFASHPALYTVTRPGTPSAPRGSGGRASR
jgi:heme-degrading monooxygenase HmoA